MKTITATAHPGRYFAPIMATTHDGKLACGCDAQGSCTCKLVPTRDAAKSKLDPQFLALAHRAVESLSNRLGRIEQHVAHRKNLTEQGLDPSAIIAAAQQKAQAHLAATYAQKVDEVIAAHRADKAEEANPEPQDIHGNTLTNTESPPDDDRYRHMRFDPSSGASAQKSEQFPMGDTNFMTREQVKAAFAARDAARKAEQQEFLREANANKAFHQNQYALVRSMKSTIERANKERWG